MTHPSDIAEQVARLSSQLGKPLLASWMGAQSVNEGRAILNSAGVPTYDYPDEAALAFVRMHEHRSRLEWLRESKTETDCILDPQVHQRITSLLANGQSLLSEIDAKDVLELAGIPVVKSVFADSEEAAVAAAEVLGYPVAMKLYSNVITHKSDCGGVQLNVLSADSARQAWNLIRTNVERQHGPRAFEGVTVQRMITGKGCELIVGSSTDAQFGPVLLFGAGGTLVEVMQDRALALPPLNRALVRRWISPTKIARVLRGVRGQKAVNMDALEEVLVRFACLVENEPRIIEADINPLLATPEGIVALDARIVIG